MLPTASLAGPYFVIDALTGNGMPATGPYWTLFVRNDGQIIGEDGYTRHLMPTEVHNRWEGKTSLEVVDRLEKLAAAIPFDTDGVCDATSRTVPEPPDFYGFWASLTLYPDDLRRYIRTNYDPFGNLTTLTDVAPQVKDLLSGLQSALGEAKALPPTLVPVVPTPEGSPPPPPPGLIAPPDASVNVTLTPTLEWGYSTGAAVYSLQVAAVGSSALAVGIATERRAYTVPAGTLAPGTTYRWWLFATDKYGRNSPLSPVFSFTTKAR